MICSAWSTPTENTSAEQAQQFVDEVWRPIKSIALLIMTWVSLCWLLPIVAPGERPLVEGNLQAWNETKTIETFPHVVEMGHENYGDQLTVSCSSMYPCYIHTLLPYGFEMQPPASTLT